MRGVKETAKGEGKTHVVKAQVCDMIVSKPLSKAQATKASKALKAKIPSAKVRIEGA